MVSPNETWGEYKTKLEEAKQRDAEARNVCFLDPIETLNGEPCSHLTVERLIILEQANSVFLHGGETDITADDILTILWVLSPRFQLNEKRARRFRAKRKRRVRVALADYSRAILSFLEKTFTFAPPKKNGGDAQGWVATIIDLLASEYHWSEREILDLPLSRAFQYVAAMRERISDNPVKFSGEADRLKAEFLKKANANG